MSALRIANCSGFYGDRLSALREQLEGSSTGPDVDVVTGDYLAELTMLILGMDQLRDADLGYARTFVRQLEDTLGLALEKGVKIVSNAGGLNPAGLAAKVTELSDRLGLGAKVAHVTGDDLRGHAGFDGALSANAYLGGFGIAAALRHGADVVVTGRVTDAALVVGPAAAHHGWSPTEYDALAGAVVAGHIIECGTQATGGNFSGFRELFRAGAPMDRPLGFPIAEVAADGSSVITKHEGTGGAVTVDTVTAQLLYEVQSTRYLNPDVTTRLDSIVLRQAGPDRVQVSGVTGTAPPQQLKVAVNTLGGYRNQVELVLTGLDVEAKADWVRAQLDGAFTAAEVTWTQTPARTGDADTEEGASVLLRCTAKDPEPGPVGKAFTGPVVELALASYPGFHVTAPPAKPTPYGVYTPAYVERSEVTHVVVHHDGSREVVADPTEFVEQVAPEELDPGLGARPSPYPAPADTITRRMPLGTFLHARSGDKGGDANLGLWVKNDAATGATTAAQYAARVQWLAKLMTPRKVRELIPEARDLDIDVYVLENLGAVNVVIHGLLGEGVASTTRFDPQAKALGEWVRARSVHIQDDLV
ncbi:DUF1446 domain-containing protein [Nocardioides sp. zg-536]|uniref:DUF1446 domain-containing protein n=1 Tax=Nocardioides faecalis TaxID=2803858 RepID=A0A938Y606_9ACTN|nr:acyclic terpene utilization AtuA family protein [Nocardioides faecalis]MBM9459854.1 DUF1446 domain-containing protein [Nocardioides faecalis]MBS4754485.1 DUF1446 domain-containing protein [Nocardioides faecalis]QVI58907.1 DUF1446 domain-containing protein [Nocardioides faecalis]